MEPIKVMIVDDEPLAQEILETYPHRIPGVALVGKCKNALEAFSLLNREEVHLMLLDINMPEITGIEFLRTLKHPPQVILTTAYPEFAVESYELNALDYLLKPVPFERFLKAIDKAMRVIGVPATNNPDQQTTQKEELIFVKSGSKLLRISLAGLWAAEGLKDYVRLSSEEGNIVVHSTMKNLEELLLPYKHFVRVHKSYIVNLTFATEVSGNLVKIKGQEIPIGSTYKEEVQKRLEAYKLV